MQRNTTRILLEISVLGATLILLSACSNSPSTSPQSEADDRDQSKIARPYTAPPPPVFVPPPLADGTESAETSAVSSKAAEDLSTPPPPFFDPQPLPQALPFFSPPPIQTATIHRVLKSTHGGKPVKFERTKIKGIPVYKMIIDLDDPQTLISLSFPNGVKHANCAQRSYGDESFDSFNKRCRGALLVNGTFFSKDDEKRVMGNIVTEGEFRKYSPWENYGTTFGIKANNELEMVTARLEGQPKWEDYWFSLTCGPRLLKQGAIAVAAEEEGFQDSHVFTIGPRSAIGFNRKKRQLIYCAFLRGLSLEKEAELMLAAGCDEAMNLDGGASRALATDGRVILKPGRALTNVLIVYDSCHPAPAAVTESWNLFQDGARPAVPQ